MTKNILLIITGSIACYKSVELIRLLRKKNYNVNCILTKGAKEFVTPLLISSIAGSKIYDDLFDVNDENEMGHIQLSRKNDLIIIAPASADFIAKIANGYADDLASATVLAADKKIIFAPAMNEKMWLNEVTQNNVTKLLQFGMQMIEPWEDKLACGEEGVGKMAAPDQIVESIDNFFAMANLLQNKNILITVGSTIEPIDPVRFIGNSSSGKQGLAIAKILAEMGANVYLIIGNINKKIDFKVKSIDLVKTAEEMLVIVKEKISSMDVFISCCAVADYKVKNFSSIKIKKSQNSQPILELEKNPDILSIVANSNLRPKLVIGFCADDGDLLSHAQEKLLNKNCDLIIANYLRGGQIFASDNTEAILVGKDFYQDLGCLTKIELAKVLAFKIVDLIF